MKPEGGRPRIMAVRALKLDSAIVIDEEQWHSLKDQ
jgi:hypothetical protein